MASYLPDGGEGECDGVSRIKSYLLLETMESEQSELHKGTFPCMHAVMSIHVRRIIYPIVRPCLSIQIFELNTVAQSRERSAALVRALCWRLEWMCEV